MTLFINARFLCQKMSGVQRFAAEIWTAFDRLLDDDPILKMAIGPVIALTPIGQLRSVLWRNISVLQVGQTRGHVWEQGALFRASKNDVLVSLGNAGPLRHAAHIVALHDANIWDIPQAFAPSYRVLHRTSRPILARRAKRLITVSTFSANRLSTHLGVSQNRFSIIPNGANHIDKVVADVDAIKRFGLSPNGYFLSVGNQSPNKNIDRLITAHGLAGSSIPPLVIVGGAVSGLSNDTRQNNERVHVLGRLSDGALRSLYEHAFGFVFPSLYEGFGIPPLEAMQLGTPVLSSNQTAMPEVLQDAPMWFDPMNVEDMANAMQQFSKMPKDERTKMRERAKQVAAQFTWEKSAVLLVQQILSLKATISNGGQGVPHHSVASKRKVS